MRNLIVGFTLTGSLLVMAPAAHATSLAPGTCAGLGCVPAAYTDFTTAGMFGAPIFADTGIQALATATFTGNLREIVISDTITGNLDFLYQVQRTGPAGGGDTIGELSALNFAGWLTDVGTCTACSAGGELLPPLNGNPHVAPGFISRSATGAEILFDFGAGIGDSNESFVLVIKTNAKTFSPGTTFVRDGNTATAAGFSPTAVPEPASLFLLGSGLIGAGARRWRSRRKSA